MNLADSIQDISYYFAVFRVNQRVKKVAVKRPAQFKALLKRKLVHFVNDSLEVLPDNVFKLDNDFDFIITRTAVEILHPTGFHFIADLEDEVQRTAEQSTRDLGSRMGFIDFAPIAEFVRTSKRGAKLIASIKSRPDLENTSPEKLARHCRNVGLEVRVRQGMVVPDPESFIGFLQVLDRREYVVDLTGQGSEVYIASSRKQVAR